jgi:hypothetical protein
MRSSSAEPAVKREIRSGFLRLDAHLATGSD